MIDAYRTPDDRFTALPDFPWTPHYTEWTPPGAVGHSANLRLARIDEGGGHPVVLLHGEPTWSFLYRKVIPPLLDAGHRCIAPDLPGFGRSDKPTDIGWYSYDNHTAAIADLLAELDIRDATFVVHDWGGPIGMRVAVENPERCARFVVMDTGIFTGHQRMTDAWIAFRDFVARTDDLPISMLVRGGCASPPEDAVLAAYDAPFPDVAAKQGARAFPQLLATSPDAPGASAGRDTARALASDSRPALLLWGDADPVIPVSVGHALAEKLGWPEPEVVPSASHFLQEDHGAFIGRRIAGWLEGQA